MICRKKNALFDIPNLTNQLLRLKSLYSVSFKCGKIYFSKNLVLNLIKQKNEYLSQAIKSYKLAVKKDLMHQKDKLLLEVKAKVENKAINKFFP